MGYSDADMNTTKISDQIYALTVQLNQPSNLSCTNVLCESSSHDDGACAYIGCKYKLCCAEFCHCRAVNMSINAWLIFVFLLVMTQIHLVIGIFSVKPETCSHSNATGQ